MTFDPALLDAAKILGGAMLARAPDLLRLRADHSAKLREQDHAEQETASNYALGLIATMTARISALEVQLADRDRQMIEREKAFSAAIGDNRHALRNLEAKFAIMTVIADMEDGPDKDRMLARVLRTFATKVPDAIVK